MTTSASRTAFTVLIAVTVSHLLNDLLQSLLPAIYPILKAKFDLDFLHIGLITLANQLTASLLQPVVGHFTDRRPQPYSLAIGMTATMSGLLLLAVAGHFGWILAAAALIGVGSAIFHPESSRIARAGVRRPARLRAVVLPDGRQRRIVARSRCSPRSSLLPRGQASIAWFSVIALVAIVILWRVGVWYRTRACIAPPRPSTRRRPGLPRGEVRRGMAILLMLVFSKYVYLASLTSYYTFFLIHKFQISVQAAQLLSLRFSRRASRRARSSAGRLAIASAARS